MGFHYEDGASRWRQCWPLSAKAPYGLRLEMKVPAKLGHYQNFGWLDAVER